MDTFMLKLTEIYLSFNFPQHGNKLKPLKLAQSTLGSTKKSANKKGSLKLPFALQGFS
jgi:hypothetical protein